MEVIKKLLPLVEEFHKKGENKDGKFYELHVEEFVMKSLGVGRFSYTLEAVILKDLIINDGKIRKDQHDLFPLRYKNYLGIVPLIKSFSGQRGDFTLALGTYTRCIEKDEYSNHYNSFIEEDYRWFSMASFPRSFSELFHYRFYGNRLEITNQEELESLGILTFPKIKDKFHNAVCVYLENILIAELEKQCDNLPEALGWWHSDSGGFGSLVFDPFLLQKTDFSRLGYIARDVFDENLAERNYCEWYFSKKYLEQYFEKYKLAGKSITHAEGNYSGRSGCNSYNTGLQKEKITILNTPEDLKEFGYKGARVLNIE